MQSSPYGRRPLPPSPGDRVALLARDGSRTRQCGLVRETRPVPNPFGGKSDLWARVNWDNGACGWMAIGRSLVVIGVEAARDPNWDPNRIY